MGIKHATSKIHGDKGLASEWNDDHVVDDDVDFSQHQILKLTIENLAAAPPAPEVGQIYYDTVDLIIKVWDGAAWQDATQLTSHTHASAAQGGQLDWDNVWSDAVHSHESNAEGGQLDIFAVADATTKERYYAVNTAAFQLEDGLTDYSLPGDMYTNEDYADQARAPVNLPHGAIVTKCQLWGNAVGQNWYLKRGRNDDGTTDQNLASAGVGVEDTSISNATIDNVNYNYWIEMYLDVGDDIYGARITYTVTADTQG